LKNNIYQFCPQSKIDVIKLNELENSFLTVCDPDYDVLSIFEFFGICIHSAMTIKVSLSVCCFSKWFVGPMESVEHLQSNL